MANESSSFALLLDHLPTENSKHSDNVANLMLKLSSQFVYSECIHKGIPHKYCAIYISRLIIPTTSNVFRDCAAVNAEIRSATGHPYRRLLPADYSDGLSKIRRTVNGHNLPSPRNISSHLFVAQVQTANDVMTSAGELSPEGKLDQSRSVLFVQWSQFVEQNLVHTPQHTHREQIN